MFSRWLVRPKWFLNAAENWWMEIYFVSCRGKCFDLFINRQNVGFTQTELFNHIICNANEATRKTKFIMNPILGEKMFCLIWRKKNCSCEKWTMDYLINWLFFGMQRVKSTLRRFHLALLLSWTFQIKHTHFHLVCGSSAAASFHVSLRVGRIWIKKDLAHLI